MIKHHSNREQTSVTHPEESYPYLPIFAPIKDFLGVYNVEQPGQT